MTTRSLDMSLDDLVRQRSSSMPPSSDASRSRTGRRNTAGGRGGSALAGASAPTRRTPNPNWRTNRLSPYSNFQKAPDSSWEHDLYTDQMGPVVGPFDFEPPAEGRRSAIELGTKLLISNLDYGVSDEDIQELFSVVGEIKHYSINYDRSGRSEGTAEVVFARHADALAAVKRYDSVLLDGKPMKIEIVGTNIKAPLPLVPHVVAPLPYARVFGNFNALTSGGFGGGRRLYGGGGFGAEARHRGQGGNFGGGRGGAGGKGKRKEQVSVSAADLDAELDRYHASAKQTS